MRISYFTLLVAMLFGGCASTNSSSMTKIANSPTGGYALTLFAKQDANTAVRFRVEKDGSIKFGGGKDAFQRDYSWTGELTNEEIAKLRDMLSQDCWYDGSITSTSTESPIEYELDLDSPLGNREIEITGDNARLNALRELLAEAAFRRNQTVIDALPRPDIESIGR